MSQHPIRPETWAPFPHSNEGFNYDTAAIKQRWSLLHQGDCEPLPTDERVLVLAPDHPDPAGVASALLEAWRLFHIGEFSKAFCLAEEIGPLAHAVANKSSGIYADYLEDDEVKQKAIYKAGMKRAQEAITLFPNDPNAHYFHAFMTGRYSQCISITTALKQGLAGQVKTDVETTLGLAPKHAEAYLALGLFHAEVIDKVGRMVGGLTYGASPDESMGAFKNALAITPDSPIAWLEYGNALYLLFGDKKIDESNEAYTKASQCKPKDAMECLDVAYALASI